MIKDLEIFLKLSEGFSKLDHSQRINRLIEMGIISEEDAKIFASSTHLDVHLAEHFIENSIGYFPIPLGVAVNFVINSKPYVIPMATEETSIIASASKTAKWIAKSGVICTQSLGGLSIGQIQIPRIKDISSFKKIIAANKDQLIKIVNAEVMQNMVQRGGGVKDLQVRSIPRDHNEEMAVLHVMVDTCNAMGANIINQVCEFLKDPIEQLTHEKIAMCILSNLSEGKLTKAKVIVHNIDLALAKAIEEASLFAQKDPYRAVTNNKGVMNAIDAVLIATGNDWRAVEAGMHAYAAMSGRYTSLTRWRVESNDLVGTIVAPMMIGIVGGVTQSHPVAKVCLGMLNVQTAQDFAGILCAVGLVQNLGALHALVTQGIIKGHMKLHLSNLAIASGAQSHELDFVMSGLKEKLYKFNRISQRDADELLAALRSKSQG